MVFRLQWIRVIIQLWAKADFLNKIYIALKECSETLYWLELLKDTKYLTEKEFVSIYSECEELEKMLTSTTKTLERKKKTKDL